MLVVLSDRAVELRAVEVSVQNPSCGVILECVFTFGSRRYFYPYPHSRAALLETISSTYRWMTRALRTDGIGVLRQFTFAAMRDTVRSAESTNAVTPRFIAGVIQMSHRTFRARRSHDAYCGRESHHTPQTIYFGSPPNSTSFPRWTDMFSHRHGGLHPISPLRQPSAGTDIRNMQCSPSRSFVKMG